MNILAVTKLTEKYILLMRGFLLQEGYTAENREVLLEAAAYLAATAILGAPEMDITFSTRLNRAIAAIKGVKDDNPDSKGNPPNGKLRRPMESRRQKRRA